MTTAQQIKYHRKRLQLSQEELGQKLLPPVLKSTVSRWESGITEGIKSYHIKQLAIIFGISPVELLSIVADENDEEKLLIIKSRRLNRLGKEKLSSYIDDLLDMEKYTI